MEASLNGCGKLLDKMNALHTTFAQQPEQEYEGHGKRKYIERSSSDHLYAELVGSGFDNFGYEEL
jgi:hypothetical protein